MTDETLEWLRRKLEENHRSRMFFLEEFKRQQDWFIETYFPSTAKEDDEPSTD